MADVPKQRRDDLMGKAVDASGIALQRLTDLSNSGNPDVAARAAAVLIVEGNRQADLNVIRQLLGNQPENALKPIPDEKLTLLGTLETSIDTQIRNSQLVNATIAGATDVLHESASIGQVIQETT